jgi:hypothetical protein
MAYNPLIALVLIAVIVIILVFMSRPFKSKTKERSADHLLKLNRKALFKELAELSVKKKMSKEKFAELLSKVKSWQTWRTAKWCFLILVVIFLGLLNGGGLFAVIFAGGYLVSTIVSRTKRAELVKYLDSAL